MNVVMSNLAQGRVQATPVAVFTNTATKSFVKLITLHNTLGTTEVVKIYRVPNNGGAVGTPDASNILFEFDVTSKDTQLIELPGQGWVLENENDAIFMESTTIDVVNVAIDGSQL